MVMKWDKFKGSIKGKGWEANVEMMDLPDRFWDASFQWLTPEGIERKNEAFEEGKLEQAYNWCKQQIENHEGRQSLASSAT